MSIFDHIYHILIVLQYLDHILPYEASADMQQNVVVSMALFNAIDAWMTNMSGAEFEDRVAQIAECFGAITFITHQPLTKVIAVLRFLADAFWGLLEGNDQGVPVRLEMRMYFLDQLVARLEEEI